MTRRDVWLSPARPAVAKYRAYKEELNLTRRGFVFPPSGGHVVFVIPFPDSYPAKKRAALEGKPHQLEKFDVDNLLKALLDALMEEGDGHIWDVRVSKVWGESGGIFIYQTKEQQLC